MKARMLANIYNPSTQEAEDLELVINLKYIVRLLFKKTHRKRKGLGGEIGRDS